MAVALGTFGWGHQALGTNAKNQFFGKVLVETTL